MESTHITELSIIDIYYDEYDDLVTDVSVNTEVDGWYSYYTVRFTFEGKRYEGAFKKHNSDNVCDTSVTATIHEVPFESYSVAELGELRKFKEDVLDICNQSKTSIEIGLKILDLIRGN